MACSLLYARVEGGAQQMIHTVEVKWQMAAHMTKKDAPR
jgi:hypothetical protein